MRVSSTLRLAVLQRRCDGTRLYQIAKAAGLHPTVVSALLHDICPIRPNDPRVLAIARVVGVPASEAFTEDGKR